MLKTSDETVEKWRKTGLLQDLDEEREYKVAQLLENQAKYLLEIYNNKPDLIVAKDVKKELSPANIDIAFPVVARLFRDLDLDWDVIQLPAGLPGTGDPVVAKTHTLSSTVRSISDEEIGSTDVGSRMAAEIELISCIVDLVRAELTEKWKNKKVWVYKPLIFSRIGETNEYNIIMRYGERDKA